MAKKVRSIAILGAGKLGITLTQLALKAGYNVYIAGSESPKKIALTIEVLTPGAKAMHAGEAVKLADVVILALPLGKFRSIPKSELANKLVVDAMNYWWEVDGDRADIVDADVSSSQAVQDFLNASQVVKALNHIGYHELHDHHKPKGMAGRRAVAIAGDDDADIETVKELINSLGFDSLYIGGLAAGAKLEPGQKAFGASVSTSELKRLLSL